MQSKIPVKRALPIIRVFVSSTFSDLKHERNSLHAKVWPELERYCQQRGFTFQAIDLRWGVPTEAGLDHRTMRICFEELKVHTLLGNHELGVFDERDACQRHGVGLRAEW